MRPVVFALLLLAASPAFAQRNTAPAPNQRVPAPAQRGTVADANDRLLDEAIQGFGVNPDRLPQRAVSDAFAELYPNTPYERTRLTPVQARAVAFTALAFAAERTGRGQGPNDSTYPPGQGYPGQAYPDPNRPGGISLQANASALAYEFLLAVGDGDDLSEAQREAAVRQGSEAAAAAAAAGCTPLASAIREIAGDLRSVGHAFSLDVEAAEQAADACR